MYVCMYVYIYLSLSLSLSVSALNGGIFLELCNLVGATSS